MITWIIGGHWITKPDGTMVNVVVLNSQRQHRVVVDTVVCDVCGRDATTRHDGLVLCDACAKRMVTR